MFTGTSADLNAVWADPDRGVFAVGDGGLVLHLADRLPAQHGGDCARPVPLHCGAPPYFGDTTAGPVHYRLDAPIDGRIDARLTAHDGELDLRIVGARADRGCAPERVLGATTARVAKHETVYAVIDGPPSGYTLSLTCTPE
jgi:hypothetical protein